MGRRLGMSLSRQTGTGRPGRARYRWISRGGGLAPAKLPLLRETLWHAAGPVRSSHDLAAARARLAPLAASGWQAGLACALLHAATQRRTSLGAHWREDLPRSVSR
jgi:L-aspartate oxidase